MKSSKIDKIAKVDKNLELPCIKKVKNALNLEVIDNGYIIEIMRKDQRALSHCLIALDQEKKHLKWNIFI